MSARSLLPLLLFVGGSACAVYGTACSSMSSTAAQKTSASAHEGHEAHDDKPVLVGYVSRDQVEAAVPDWVQAEVEAAPDPAAVQALVALTSTGKPGADVTVYLGTWCGDSRRELARLWRAMDDCGGVAPFAVEYIAVDRTKKEPADLVDGSGLLYVPTLIVRRDGREVGRIVEQSPNGIERDLLHLLDGSAQGLLTAKPELLPEKQP
jgi:hypothetical protein